MRPSAPAPGVGAGDPPSCRPAGLPRFPKLPPTASLTARSTSLAQQLACPPLPAGLGPALPSGRLSTGIQPEEWNGVGRPQQPGPRDLGQAPPFAQHILLVASSLRSPRAGVTVQLPAPRYWDLSLSLSHPPPHGSYWGALPGPGSGRGWGSADQVDPPVQHLHVSTAPPMVAAKTQGPGRKLCPKSPRKYQHQSLGRWNLITKPVMAQPAPDLPPPWQTGWGQQVALCCLQSLGTAGAPSDLQITLTPVHSTQQSLSQQASDYKLNRHALVHLQCG